MNNNLRLSVIMPVYNAERWLDKSVGSLFRQGLDAGTFEVLLVNDGSKDNSLEVCRQLAEKHPEIRVIDKPNGGIADARNRGLDEANGEWIAFLDDDDYLLDNGLSIVFKPYMNRKDIDLIRYGSDYDFWPLRPIDKTVLGEGRAWDLIREGKAYLPGFLWIHCFRRSFLEKHHMRFEDVAMSDDYLFASSVYLYNPYVLLTNAIILRYVVHEGSGSTSRPKAYSRKVAHDSVVIYVSLYKLAEQVGATKNKALWSKCLPDLNTRKRLGITRMLSSRYTYKEFKQMRKWCRETGYYPMSFYGDSRGRLRAKLELWVMNAVMRSWFWHVIFRFVEIHIVEPYILPHYRYHLK